jgi:hypothetical protein
LALLIALVYIGAKGVKEFSMAQQLPFDYSIFKRALEITNPAERRAYLNKRPGYRKLSDEEFEKARALVITYLAEHTSISNREFRSLTQLDYDQAITFFKKMVTAGTLVRAGKTTSTRYSTGQTKKLAKNNNVGRNRRTINTRDP